MPITSSHHDDPAPDGLLAHAVVDPASLASEHEALVRRRRIQRLGALFMAFAAFVVVLAIAAQASRSDSTTGAAAPKVTVASEATGVLLLRPDHDPVRLATARPVVGASAHEQGSHASYALDQVATVERITTDARVAIGKRTAAAWASAERIDLLDGRVQLTGARLDATAASADGRASGALELSDATTLLVDGTEHAIGVNERIVIEGVGTVIVNEQAVVANAPTGDAQTGPRYRTVGALVHLRVTQDALGMPAGSDLVIGRVDAGVREGKVRKVEHPAPGVVTSPSTPSGLGQVPGLQRGEPAPGESSLPRRPVSVRGNGAGFASAGLSGYLFPVLGKSSFSNDWHAPRASTGVPHQGNDIFAEEGTPIVAVADGVLDRVGWNAIGGYRFWLFDQYGNSFYHAHLSAYSPLAVDGARVRRGDVIGFVGHTGDAQYTPPHLHFEVHPGNGEATNPFPFLNAWKHGVAVAIGLVTQGDERVAPLALLNVSDIAANSGLQQSVLDHVHDTSARPIEQETEPRPTDKSLAGAIDGSGTTPAA
ncbi:MAG: M23 family metallopeptidase [Thermoleophilia bacterium]|nr:M23 family metallopeptidase [Thermoleophilia bacterium]